MHNRRGLSSNDFGAFVFAVGVLLIFVPGETPQRFLGVVLMIFGALISWFAHFS